MKFEEVKKIIVSEFGENILYESTQPYLHKFLYDFIADKQPGDCLELGFAHGVSSCFIGASLDKNGGGHLLTIDRKTILDDEPLIKELLAATGLSEYVEFIYADISYNWELMKIIEKNTKNNICEPIFDFCFIDGGHTWETSGFAFFLVEKLLKNGGWLVMDDVPWSFATSRSLKNTEMVKAMPDDQKTTQQIRKVCDLLIKQHESFSNFNLDESLGIFWCQKIKD